MKLFGWEILPAKALESIGREVTELKDQLDTVTKSAYSTLWQLGLEAQLFGTKVTKPYSQVPSYYKAIKAIADNAPQAEIGFFDWGSNEEVFPDDLVRLFENPNPDQSQQDFVQEVVGYHAMNGEHMIRKVARTIGQAIGTQLPAELRPLDPKKMEHILGERDGRLVIVAWNYDGRETIPAEQVIHVKDFNPDDPYRGLPPEKPLEGIIELDNESLQYNKSFFKNYAQLGLMLSTDKPLTPDQREQIKAWLKKEHTGSGKQHKTAVFENGLKPTVTGSTHKDMEFTEQRKGTEEQIIGTLRAPKALFNITDDLNYATFMGQMKIFALYTLAPIFRKVEGGLNRGVIYPYNKRVFMRMKLENMPAFQEDFKDKVQTGQMLIQMGQPLNAVNEKLNLGFDDVPWGDTAWIPIGNVPADEYDTYASMESYEDVEDDADDDDQKAVKGLKGKAGKVWKGFLRRQAPLERTMADKVKRYRYQQRLRALASLEQHKTQVVLDWTKEDEELKKMLTPIIKTAIESGVAHASALLGEQKGVNEEQTAHRINSYLQVRATNITRTNRTVQSQIGRALEEGIAAGETQEQLAERVRDVFNMAGKRARSIARTETSGAVNGGSDLYYEEKGVSREWITAGDENVRDSHRDANHEVRRPGQAFSNGLRYPGDQQAGDPGEVVNCRCTIAPVIGE